MIFYLIIEHLSCMSARLNDFVIRGLGNLIFPAARGAWNLINWYWRVPTAGRPRITLHNSNWGCGVTAARCGAALLSADGSVQQVLQPCAENEFISVKMSRVWRRSYPDPAGPRPAGCSPSAGEETKRDSDEVEAARTMNPCFFLFCF